MGSLILSLPPASQAYLEQQLDKNNKVDADLRAIAHYMSSWATKLATPLSLKETDIDNIKAKYPKDSELQK